MRSAADLTNVPFAGAQGLLDDLPVEVAHEFETFFHDWLERTEPELLKVIRDTRALSDDLRERLTRAVQAAKTAFTEKRSANEHHDAHAEDGGEG